MNHYLIVFDRARGEIVRSEQYETRSESLRARFDAEREFRSNDNIEVVVLGARSQEDLSRTHSRYFTGLSQLIRATLGEMPA